MLKERIELDVIDLLDECGFYLIILLNQNSNNFNKQGYPIDSKL